MDILDKYVKKGRRTASRIWGRTAVVLVIPIGKPNIEKQVFELSPTGTWIWKLLENKPRLREIAQRFAHKKRIKSSIAVREMVKFIKKLAAKNIVEILDDIDEE